jgi:site-specific recombinase XerD
MEGLRLRVKDVDLDDRQVLVVRKAKGDKDRVARPARSMRLTAWLPDDFRNQRPWCH